ncbi:MAG: HisA/HisF-related TIM barrel protein [Pirellulales bacterium]
MLILPVLDLKQGLVVRGVAGQRATYRPVESCVADDAQPQTVAAAFVEKLGLRQAYIADLDAIGGAEPDWAAYCAVAAAGLELWVDAGMGDLERAQQLAAFSANGQPITRLIAGLESLESPARLAELVAATTSRRAAFSLDLKGGVPLLAAMAVGWRGKSPLEIAEAAVNCGVRTMIVLDLAQVGMAGGVGTLDLCRQIRARWPTLELIGGGGVRSLADLRSLAEAGYNGALVASGLHNGQVTKPDLKAAAHWT